MGKRKSFHYKYKYPLHSTHKISGERFRVQATIGSGVPKKMTSARKTADSWRKKGHKARIKKDKNGYLYVLVGPKRRKKKR